MRIRCFRCLLCIALALLSYVKIDAQTLEITNKDNSVYLRFTKQGITKNGLQIGKWQNVNANNVIYKEYYFDDNGQPIGVWKINFPDGRLRKEIEYVNTKVVRVTRYSRSSDKHFEIISSEGLIDSTYLDIENHEEDIFISEGKELKVAMKNDRGQVTSSGEWQYDYYGAIDGLVKVLINNKFTGTLDIWRINKDHWKKYSFKEGIYRSVVDSYKNGVIHSQEEYDERGKKTRITKFDEKGNIVQEKSFD
ncbi:MAG TPA: hypothetical protein PLP88_02270 [Bacteroidales bacterium]|nr:hypothetical protein [Bacteroidales bacterium]